MSYLSGVLSSKVTPQSEPIPGREDEMVVNNAGGYTFVVDLWTRLQRFLILGSEGGSYYTGEKVLTLENAKCVQECMKEDGLRTVLTVVEISHDGRAPKNDPAIFALAVCASYGDEETRKAALAVLPRVCRIGTHLFQFVDHVNGMRGWGPALRKAISAWYTDRSPESLGTQLVKYQQRGKWSHRDVLRLAHPGTGVREKDAALRWAVAGVAGLGNRTVRRGLKEECVEACYEDRVDQLPLIIAGYEVAKNADSERTVVQAIIEYGLPHECVPTEYKTSPKVWEALLPKMGITALIRNLANMTRYGLIAPMSEATNFIAEKLGNQEFLQNGRIHPLSLLVALNTYNSGKSGKGDNTWTPVTRITDALNDAFYLAFKNVVPTNKRWLLALDVSSSMASPEIAGMPGITPRIGSAAMALITAVVEKQHHFVGFTDNLRTSRTGLTPLDISPRQRLDDVIRAISGLPFGGTDCAQPMLYASQKKIPVDVFVVYTDSETWAGSIQPVQALKQYRDQMGIDARLVVVGMTANEFTIADPKDAGMLDVTGFDTAVPALMSEFAFGHL